MPIVGSGDEQRRGCGICGRCIRVQDGDRCRAIRRITGARIDQIVVLLALPVEALPAGRGGKGRLVAYDLHGGQQAAEEAEEIREFSERLVRGRERGSAENDLVAGECHRNLRQRGRGRTAQD